MLFRNCMGGVSDPEIADSKSFVSPSTLPAVCARLTKRFELFTGDVGRYFSFFAGTVESLFDQFWPVQCRQI